jgi:hypothetical protein
VHGTAVTQDQEKKVRENTEYGLSRLLSLLFFLYFVECAKKRPHITGDQKRISFAPAVCYA